MDCLDEVLLSSISLVSVVISLILKKEFRTLTRLVEPEEMFCLSSK